VAEGGKSSDCALNAFILEPNSLSLGWGVQNYSSSGVKSRGEAILFCDQGTVAKGCHVMGGQSLENVSIQPWYCSPSYLSLRVVGVGGLVGGFLLQGVG